MLNGGHYISYACNPNGNWYCYNDSSCREVLTDAVDQSLRVHPTQNTPPPTSRRERQRIADKETDDVKSADQKNDLTASNNDVTAMPVVSSTTSSAKCAYSDVRVPKIDTSSAYILFYERSGLDYKPYLPEVVSNGHAAVLPSGVVGGGAVDVELDENESELRKQLCSLQ